MGLKDSETITLKKAHSVAEVAEQISGSVSFVRKQIRLGKLKARLLGSRVMILDSDLNEYLNSRPEWSPENERAAAAV